VVSILVGTAVTAGLIVLLKSQARQVPQEERKEAA